MQRVRELERKLTVHMRLSEGMGTEDFWMEWMDQGWLCDMRIGEEVDRLMAQVKNENQAEKIDI